jgi:AraC-like DNA-binding protein
LPDDPALKLYIKNMVCQRCKMAVQLEVEKAGWKLTDIELGEITIREEPDRVSLEKFDRALHHLGFELIDDRKSRIIEKIKNTIVELVHHRQDQRQKFNLSVILSEKLHYDYTYLSNLFSEVEGSTIEKFLIAQRIEKAKELLVYDEKNLSQIADELGYSSVAHLSAQFKKSTGLTPTFYKSLKAHKRRNIEEL